ncbi:thrombopoietin isoform X3 [Phyllostomus hastatus]|uniref:thrombopoietin isoform X3 n=1 Tax=Phyllostomus hastatus TaxID=9423 RepID=UPI001E67E213|nr:thrombopoietin isoform X3 [Phyllostomus hastatus]
MENPDGTDQGTGRPGSNSPSAGGSDGSTGTAGTHLPLIPTGTAFWTGPPPPWGPAGPPRNPASSTGQDCSLQRSQCHLPELPATAPRKGAFPAACSRAHPLCRAGPAHHSCPTQCLSIAHTEQASKQDFWIVGDKLQCLRQNYWLWSSEEAARIQSQGSWSAEPNLQVPRPNPRTPERDTWTFEWNSWTLSRTLAQGPGNPEHSSRSFGHKLPAPQPPAWIFSFPNPSSPWTTYTLLPLTHFAHPHGQAPTPSSRPLCYHAQPDQSSSNCSTPSLPGSVSGTVRFSDTANSSTVPPPLCSSLTRRRALGDNCSPARVPAFT